MGRGGALLQSEGHFVHLGVCHELHRVREGREHHGEGDLGLVQLEVHTETGGPVGGREEGGAQRLAVGAIAVAELRLEFRVQRIIPVLDGLQAYLRGDAQLVVVDQIVVVLVRRGGDESQLGVHEAFPLPLLAVVIVGEELEVAQQRVGALAAVVPVVRDVALRELQRAAAARHPPVGLMDDDIGVVGLDVAHAFGLEELEDGGARPLLAFDVVAVGGPGLNLCLGEPHQVHVPQIGGQQGAVRRLVCPFLAGEGEGVRPQGADGGGLQRVGAWGGAADVGEAGDGPLIVREGEEEAIVVGREADVAFGRGGVVEVVQHADEPFVGPRDGVQAVAAGAVVARHLQHEVRAHGRRQRGSRGAAAHGVGRHAVEGLQGEGVALDDGGRVRGHDGHGCGHAVCGLHQAVRRQHQAVLRQHRAVRHGLCQAVRHGLGAQSGRCPEQEDGRYQMSVLHISCLFLCLWLQM